MFFRKKKLAQQAIAEHTTLKSAAKTAQKLHAFLQKSLDASLAQTLQSIDSDYAATIQRARAELEKAKKAATTSVQTANRATVRKAAMALAPWTASVWNAYMPPSQSVPLSLIRLGELYPNHLNTHLPPMPALLPFVGHQHILISFSDRQSRLGASVLESLAWRVAALSLPRSYRFVLFDPLDRGTNLASLLRLPDDIRGTKIYSQDNEIEQALQQVTGDIEEIIQRRLLNTYRDLEAYNVANPDVAVPYCFIVLVGFPKGFTAKSADLLFSIARTGKRAGCYLLGGVLRGEKPPHGFDFAAFMKRSTYVSVKTSTRLQWNDPEFPEVTIQPDSPPSTTLVDRLVKAIQPLATASTMIPFQRIAVRKAHWWKASTVSGLAAPIGIDESGEIYNISVGKDITHHALVGGATGMGKTNLLHLFVLMLSIKYSPDELALYLVDFKEGVEFQVYVSHALPHARAIVLEAEREFGLSILERLVEEMEKRSQEFKTARVSGLQEYRKRTGRTLPRVLLVMDEYVVLFSEDDRLSFQASEALAALVMRGRSFGIHVLLSAQRPASTFLSMSQIKSQMGLRLAFKCRPEDSALILGEGNEKAARLSQAGEACITADPDNVSATTHVRIARVTPDERDLYLRGLHEFAQQRHYGRKSPMVVFSRDAPAIWLQNHSIARRFAMAKWRPFPDPCFWLGQPLRIAKDISVSMETRQGANLLVLGSDESLAARLILSMLQGLVVTTSPQEVQFLVIGAADSKQPADNVLTLLQDKLPHTIQLCVRQTSIDTLNKVVEKMDARLARLPALSRQRIFLIIVGLHRWREVRGPNAYTPSPAGEQLGRLIQQGPEIGIHTLMWCDRLSALGSVVSAGAAQEVAAQFRYRVALQMTSDESVNFLGVPAASKLGSERAYYRDEQWPADILDKFKPYALLSNNEVNSFISTVKDRWNVR